MEFEVHNIGFQHLGCGFGLGAIRVAHRLGAVAWRRRWGLDNGFGVGSRWLRAGKKAEKPWSPGRVGGRSHAQAGAGCRGPDRLGLAGAFRLELGAVPIGLLAVWRGLTRPGMGSAGFSGLAATGCSAQGVVAGRHTGGCGSAFGLGGGARRQRRGRPVLRVLVRWKAGWVGAGGGGIRFVRAWTTPHGDVRLSLGWMRRQIPWSGLEWGTLDPRWGGDGPLSALWMSDSR